MIGEAQLIWEALELRAPTMLTAIDGLSDDQMSWSAPRRGNSIAWLLWHIAEVEDNWVRDKLYHEARRFPFGMSVRDAEPASYPGKGALLDYYHDVRALSRERLERTIESELRASIADDHFGAITGRQLWVGVATSGAWHGGQIVMMANRLVPR